MLSFDVTSLYTNAPIAPTLERVEQLLEEAGVSPTVIDEYLELLRLCLKTNICQFNGELFEFPDGLPMGSPLSSLMANIFMDQLENDIFTSNNLLTSCAHYWFRYVDDILCLGTGPANLVQNSLSLINSFSPSINFTLEFGGPTINFLDLIINIINQRHSFKIFRKPTYTDVIIPASSFRHPVHKNASYMSMIHRLLSAPLFPQDFNNEVNTIKYSAHTNEFTLDIDKLIRKTSCSMLLDSTTTHRRSFPPSKWTRIPLLGKVSFKLFTILKRSGTQPGFYSFHTSRKSYPTSKILSLLMREAEYTAYSAVIARQFT